VHFAAEQLTHLLESYGYWAVLGFVLMESMGIPVPGETVLLAAAVYAGESGNLFIGFVILAAAAGAIMGDNIGYFVGREGGFRLLRRYGHYVRLDDKKIKVGQYLFLRHGAAVFFFGRFVALLRALAALLAGVGGMDWRRFFAANAAGGILWATIYGLLGWALGNAADQFESKASLILGIVGGLAFVIGIIVTIKYERELEQKAEEALPGPLMARPKLKHAGRRSKRSSRRAA
jgi:membrane protein DedA with SNARE-associated domain